MPATSAVPKTTLIQCAASRGLSLPFVSVLISGTVTQSVVPATLGAAVGSKAEISFLMLPTPTDRIANDGSGVHLMDGIGAYPICNETFSLSVGKLSATMGDAAPATEYVPQSLDTFFSVVSKRPVNDGVFIAPSATTVKPLPLLMSGAQGLYTPDWTLDFSIDYQRGTFPSLTFPELGAKSYSYEGVLSSEFALTTGFATNTVLNVKLDSIKFEKAKVQ